MSTVDEARQLYRRMELVPIASKEVVVEHVGDDACVVSVRRAENGRAFLDNGVLIGERIDLAVKKNARADAWRVARIVVALDEVAYEIAEHNVGIVVRECQVCQVVHQWK